VPGRTKVAELNTPIPTDRVYFQYTQFHNALQSATTDINGNPIVSRQSSVNRYIFGVEKTLPYDWWSVELRMPLYAGHSSAFNDGLFVSSSDQVGNLSVIVKRMLYQSDTHVMTIGCGFSTPTGGDSNVVVGDELYTVKNESVHVLPYMMFLWMPRDRLFAEATLQADIPISGNRVTVEDYGPPVLLGRLNAQSLLHFTATAGYWVYSAPQNTFVTGIATLIGVQEA
jgi:hypothetical protein